MAGRGYGHATPEAERAIDLLADREGVTLEPVYTGKAMAALLELNRRGAFGDGPVLYWHTSSQHDRTRPPRNATGAVGGPGRSES